jgi:transposase
MAQMTLITGAERRRRWSSEERRQILAEANAPGAIIAEVARRADVCTSLIYKWRPIPSGVRVWTATGHTDMRGGMQGLALTVQEGLKRDPHAGDLYIFRGRRGDLAKILWHDGIGLSVYAKRLNRGKFIWPSASGDAVSISPAQMAYMLKGIDWRNPQVTWRPKSAG